MPRIVACGGRRQAYEDFCTALAQGRRAILLVDSEDPVMVQSPWLHLRQRKGDEWPMPDGSTDDDCHLMVQCMESWLLADRETLRAYFGQGYNGRALPQPENPIESVSRESAYQALVDATKKCKSKSPYTKGGHSFELLSRIDPRKVVSESPWAFRLVESLKKRMGR